MGGGALRSGRGRSPGVVSVNSCVALLAVVVAAPGAAADVGGGSIGWHARLQASAGTGAAGLHCCWAVRWTALARLSLRLRRVSWRRICLRLLCCLAEADLKLLG